MVCHVRSRSCQVSLNDPTWPLPESGSRLLGTRQVQYLKKKARHLGDGLRGRAVNLTGRGKYDAKRPTTCTHRVGAWAHIQGARGLQTPRVLLWGQIP